MLQCPSKLDFDMTLQTNAIKGCQVTLEDAQIMWKIWGPSVIKMKGNSTQEKTIRKLSNILALPGYSTIFESFFLVYYYPSS